MLVVGCALVGAGASSCSDDVCAQETVDRAVAFLDAHQSCASDADCVVVSDYCEALPGGWCGQLVMSREGKESATWKELDAELRDCGPSECSVCGGALVPACNQGSCSPPPTGD